MSGNTKHSIPIIRGETPKKVLWSTGTAVLTFFIGVILLWSFGKDWFNFNSPLVFLAALIAVAIPVLIFAGWQIFHRS
jgi:hypothetical protein